MSQEIPTSRTAKAGHRILIHGAACIGKTRFAAEAGDPIVVFPETGRCKPSKRRLKARKEPR